MTNNRKIVLLSGTWLPGHEAQFFDAGMSRCITVSADGVLTSQRLIDVPCGWSALKSLHRDGSLRIVIRDNLDQPVFRIQCAVAHEGDGALRVRFVESGGQSFVPDPTEQAEPVVFASEQAFGTVRYCVATRQLWVEPRLAAQACGVHELPEPYIARWAEAGCGRRAPAGGASVQYHGRIELEWRRCLTDPWRELTPDSRLFGHDESIADAVQVRVGVRALAKEYRFEGGSPDDPGRRRLCRLLACPAIVTLRRGGTATCRLRGDRGVPEWRDADWPDGAARTPVIEFAADDRGTLRVRYAWPA